MKDTSILTVIGVAEMTRQGDAGSILTFRTVEIYTSLALMYFVLNTVLSVSAVETERRDEIMGTPVLKIEKAFEIIR